MGEFFDMQEEGLLDASGEYIGDVPNFMNSPLQCFKCKRGFQRKDALKQHNRDKHSPKSEPLEKYKKRFATMIMHNKVAIDNEIVEEYPKGLNGNNTGWIECLEWLMSDGLKELDDINNYATKDMEL